MFKTIREIYPKGGLLGHNHLLLDEYVLWCDLKPGNSIYAEEPVWKPTGSTKSPLCTTLIALWPSSTARPFLLFFFSSFSITSQPRSISALQTMIQLNGRGLEGGCTPKCRRGGLCHWARENQRDETTSKSKSYSDVVMKDNKGLEPVDKRGHFYERVSG